MRKKAFTIGILVFVLTAAALAVVLSPASLEELLIKRYRKLHMPSDADHNIAASPGALAELNAQLKSFEENDPMRSIDPSVIIYRAAEGAMIKAAPEDPAFAVPQGQLLMFRGMLGGIFKLQCASGDLYYAESLDGFEFAGLSAEGLTNTAEIPVDSLAYTVSYGDRVLRYAPELILEDNAALIVTLGQTVHALKESGAFFRVALEDGSCGWLNSQCLEPAEPQGYRSDLPVVDAGKTTYGYYEMMQDISELLHKYPESLRLLEVGESVAGNGIPVLLLGNPDAPHKMLVQASIHAREYPTTLILLKQLEILLDELSQGQHGNLFDGAALILVPMANPDGAMLSMTGEALLSKEYRESIHDMGGDPMAWKANLNGVDLNRNFDANWDKIEQGVTQPGGERFRGYAPESEPETLLLKKYTDMDSVVATVSYHTCGSILYWWYYQGGELLSYSKSLAEAANVHTGYGLINRRGSYGSHGGLKDYGVTLGKPGLTIEFGRYGNPISFEETQKALVDSEGLLVGLAQWVGEKYE